MVPKVSSLALLNFRMEEQIVGDKSISIRLEFYRVLVKNGKSTSYNKRQRGDVEVDDDEGEHRKHEQEGLFGGGRWRIDNINHTGNEVLSCNNSNQQ